MKKTTYIERSSRMLHCCPGQRWYLCRYDRSS